MDDGKIITCTLITGANPTIFVRARDLDLNTENFIKNDYFHSKENIISKLCEYGSNIMKIENNASVRVGILFDPVTYIASNGEIVQKEDLDIVSQISTEGRMHHAYTGTGAINLACAARIKGMLVYEMLRGKNEKLINIGHPQGIIQMNANVNFDEEKAEWIIESSGFFRTARIIMSGDVYTA
jgi:2-methylaconitate cis-trans-isomerase PrpF